MVDLTVLHPADRDADGNRSDTVTESTLTGCAVAPAGSSNAPSSIDVDQRASDGLRERLDVFCPDPDAAVSHVDRIRFNGVVYEVDGNPDRWGNPFTGSRPGCVIHMSREVG